MTRTRTFSALLLLLVAVVVGACGTDDEGDGDSGTTKQDSRAADSTKVYLCSPDREPETSDDSDDEPIRGGSVDFTAGANAAVPPLEFETTPAPLADLSLPAVATPFDETVVATLVVDSRDSCLDRDDVKASGNAAFEDLLDDGVADVPRSDVLALIGGVGSEGSHTFRMKRTGQVTVQVDCAGTGTIPGFDVAFEMVDGEQPLGAFHLEPEPDEPMDESCDGAGMKFDVINPGDLRVRYGTNEAGDPGFRGIVRIALLVEGRAPDA